MIGQDQTLQGAAGGPVDPSPDNSSDRLNGLSIDVEDYFHVEAFADRIRPEDWPQFPSRVAGNTRRVLEILAKAGARATFFVLGWVAEREPKLVGEILSAGHEVGCHSYRHSCIWKLTPEEFRADTRRAVCLLEDAAGQKIAGYRAPTFSLKRETLWALEIMAEEGFRYDSSVFPIRHDTYGMPDAPRHPFRWIGRGGASLFEIPLGTVRVLGRNLPAGGGGYLRILPMWYTRWAMRRTRGSEQRPLLVYFHPWEIDPQQPRLTGRWKSLLRHYTNLDSMERRIREVLGWGKFVPLGELLAQMVSAGPLPERPMIERN